MIRLNPTRLELRIEDLTEFSEIKNEFEAIKKARDEKQKSLLEMEFKYKLSNEANLNRSHHVIIQAVEMFIKPIQNGVLNRSTLFKGLTNMTIHKNIKNYFCFTELSLNNLNLKNIDIVGDYIFLKKLVLHHNFIEDLSTLNKLNELQSLDVSYNCLEHISNFNIPKLLNYIDYSNNNIEHLDSLANFWCLAYLDLSHNIIKHVNGLSGLMYLKFINLSHNCIKQISYSLPHNLVVIDISYNDIEEIQLDMSLSMCEVLNMSYNKIKLLNFLKNAKQLSVLNIQNNMIDDVLQIEYLKTLTNLKVLKVENNKCFETNIHKQILSNNLPQQLIINEMFIKTEDLQELNKMEIYSMLTAKKNSIQSTLLEHLSGRSPICENNYGPNNVTSLPIIILVGPSKTYKKYFLSQILMKHAEKFYQAFIYTTNNVCINKIFKQITPQDFIKMNHLGKFLFSYQFLGHSYGLAEDELYKCINQNKILITFANLEGALSIKLKGYNPILILLLPEDKLFYKKNIYQSIKKHMDQNSQFIEKKTTSQKKSEVQIVKTKYGKSTNPKRVELNLESLAVCPSDTDKNADGETESILKPNYNFNDNFNDVTANDSCKIFYNECLDSIKICYNLYENSSDIFHSLIYVDHLRNALKEISTVMVDVYNKYQNNQILIMQKQPNKHTFEHLQTRIKQLYNELNDLPIHMK